MDSRNYLNEDLTYGEVNQRVHPKVIMVRSQPVNPDVRIEKEAETLSMAGFDVIILGWGKSGKKSVRLEKRSGYLIRRFQFWAPWGKKVVFFLPFWWIFETGWLLKNQWDIVHAADFDTLVPALIVAKLKRKYIIYDIFDYYAESTPMPHILRAILGRLDRYLMNYVDKIIVVDPSRLKQIGRENDSTVAVIFNSPSDHLTTKKLSDKDTPRDSGDFFRIFYAGVLPVDRDIKSMIHGSMEFGDVSIEIAGYGYQENEIKEICGKYSRSQFIGAITYETVIEKTLQADLLFALYDPKIPNNRYASPNKLFEAMMCGKPILVSDNTAMADVVKEENCGLVVPYGDIDAIKGAINKLKGDPDLCKCLGDNGRKAYEKKYNWTIMEERLMEIYNGLYKNIN